MPIEPLPSRSGAQPPSPVVQPWHRVKGYAVVRMLPTGWEVTEYFFGDNPAVRADRKMRKLNLAAGRKEYGVFAAIDTPQRCGLWFEFE